MSTPFDAPREEVIGLQLWVAGFPSAQKQHPEMMKLINSLFQARNALEAMQAEVIAKSRRAMQK